MKIRTSLSLAAFVGAVSTAHATDLLQLPSYPLEYVQACNAHGEGYFKLPGSSTCIKLGGYVRTWYQSYNLLETPGLIQEGMPETVRIYNSDTYVDRKFITTNKIVTLDGKTIEGFSRGTLTEFHAYEKSLRDELEKRKNASVGTEPTDAYETETDKTVAITKVEDEISKLALNETVPAVEEKRNNSTYSTRFLMSFESKTATDYADIETYAEFYTTWSASGDSEWSAGIVYVDLDFGNVSFRTGYDQSLFAPFVGYTSQYNSVPVGYVETWQSRTTYDLGNAATVALGVESSEYAGGAPGGVDFTSAFTFDLAPLSFGASAIMHAYDTGKYGYGVTSYITAEPTDKLSVGIGGTYGQNVLNYLTYLNPAELKDGDLTGWNVFGGVQYQLTDTVSAAVDAGYTALEVDGESYNITGISGNVTYEPVSGLTFMVEGGWHADSENNDNASVVSRVQFSF